MARVLVPTSEIQISVTPKAFKGGTGSFLSLSHHGNERVSFSFTGRLLCLLPPQGAGDPNRYAVSLSVDGDENADLREWLEELSALIVEHVANNAATIFPGVPGATADFIRSSEFRIAREFEGGHSLKLRFNINDIPVTIPNPKAAADDTKVSAMKVPARMLDRVLVQGANVSAQTQLAYVYLDNDTADFGITIGMQSAYVTSSPPRVPMRLSDFASLLPDIRFVDRKKYKSGQGSYAGMSLKGGYPFFALNETIGADSDAMRVAFGASAGPDAAPGDPLKSFSVDVPAGTPLSAALHGMSDLVVDRATEAGKDWFPSVAKLTRERALMNLMPPHGQKDDYTPALHIRISATGRAGGDATKVWIVPEDYPTVDLVEAIKSGTPDLQVGCLEAIERDCRVSVAGQTTCAWIQEKKYGWSLNASHVFVHRGSTAPLMAGDREVLISGEATADDIMAHFGQQAAEPDEPDHGTKRPAEDEADDDAKRQCVESADGDGECCDGADCCATQTFDDTE